MIALTLLAAAALIGSVAWFAAVPRYEPAIAIVTSVSALIGSWIAKRRRLRHSAQRQSVAEGAVGVQAGRDISIGDVNTGKNRHTNAQ